MIDLLRDILPHVITIILGVGAWGYENRKKRLEIKKIEQEISRIKSDSDAEIARARAEVTRYETENNASIMGLYQEALNDLKKRNDERFKELQGEIDNLRKRLEARDNDYNKLKKEFLEYKSK